MFHMEAKRMISLVSATVLTIMNLWAFSISTDRLFREEAIKGSSSTRSSYFSWRLTATPMMPESFCASRIPAMLGMYSRFSSSSCTFFTVSSDTLWVLPWITLETVAVLRPSSSAMSLILMRFSSI